MRFVVTRMLLPCALVTALAVGCVGCKKKQDAAGQGEAARAAAGRVAPPKELLIYIGVRSPQQTIDNALGLVGQFVPLPLSRDGLLDLFSQRARLPRDLIEAIDITRPFWLLGLNDKLIKDKDPAVMVFPIRSRQAFEAALGKKLRKAGVEGKLTRYAPKPGAVGQEEVKLLIADRFVIAPSSARALAVTEPFIRETLLRQGPPRSDVVMYVVVKNVMEDREGDLDRSFQGAMDKMKANLQRPAGPVDQRQVAGAAEKALQRYIDALKSTAEIRLAVDVSKEQLTVSVQGDGRAGGRLARLTARQRPGEPFGYRLLPRSSWLVLSDRGNPEAARESDGTWRPLLRQLVKGVEPAGLQQRLAGALVATSDVLTGDFSLALHRAPSGQGLTLSLVSRVTDAGQAHKALQDVAGALGQWFEAIMRQGGEDPTRDLKVERKAFAHASAKGELFRFTLRLPAEREQQLARLVGLPLTLGVAFAGEVGLLCAGKQAEAQLQRLAAAVAGPGKLASSLADSPAFSRARSAARDRVGLLYVSAVDFVRWFEGTGHQELEAIAAAIRGQQVNTAPSLDWGVNKERTTADLTARLPAEHFRVFKPILEELRKRGGGGGLLGGSRGGWQDL